MSYNVIHVFNFLTDSRTIHRYHRIAVSKFQTKRQVDYKDVLSCLKNGCLVSAVNQGQLSNKRTKVVFKNINKMDNIQGCPRQERHYGI